ncbi:hypothetical protein AAMO2058_001446300 [Amorphochlora amoebiformis]|uniref:Uncharacterized protein n=1 Tax=Amorphochlora amoebiformis TaxID=1561963 RepID=A0A7S0H0W9_9EUKA
MEHVKVVVVGDQAVGKSSLLLRLTTGEKATDMEYTATIFDAYSHILQERPVFSIPTSKSSSSFHLPWSRKKKPVPPSSGVSVQIVDTGGAEQFNRLRTYCYQGADVIVLAFSVIAPPTFDGVEFRWVHEIRRFAPKAEIVLVGCKTDLRENKQMREMMRSRNISMIQPEDGTELANRLGFYDYFECSATTGQGVDGVIEGAVASVLARRAAPRLKESSSPINTRKNRPKLKIFGCMCSDPGEDYHQRMSQSMSLGRSCMAFENSHNVYFRSANLPKCTFPSPAPLCVSKGSMPTATASSFVSASALASPVLPQLTLPMPALKIPKSPGSVRSHSSYGSRVSSRSRANSHISSRSRANSRGNSNSTRASPMPTERV